MVIQTPSNLREQINGDPLATRTVKGDVAVGGSFNSRATLSLMKLWVEPLSIKATSLCF
ncbi:unnamed protein product [Brassica oleracea var. botrytis]